MLPGELGRFVLCSIGANHCRLRHLGWERCGHGLSSRPRESASEPFLNELSGLFSYPPGSARALLEGVGREVCWVSGSGPGRKRIRPNRKTPAHLAGLVVRSRPRVWKRLCHVGHPFVSIPDHKRRRCDQDGGGCSPVHERIGGFVLAHVSRFARF